MPLLPLDEVSMDADEMDLGSCCDCGTRSGVRNLLMLSFRSPSPGDGCWGCVVCGLPSAGAVAVLCDRCIERTVGTNINPLMVCVGFPRDNRRIPYTQLTESFDHDMAKHLGGNP